jgi:hypothetical protein
MSGSQNVKTRSAVHAAAQAAAKSERQGEREGHLRLEALGLEAEFTVSVDGLPTQPERLFADPRDFLPNPAMHRIGTSYHLPNGGAVYFDTGVVEIVTPAMELERGTAVRAGRSLWESIATVRDALDRWESRTGRRLLLAGFSTHYNVSVDSNSRRMDRLARLLTYVLPAPVMLLAANRRSTGIGVRPRLTRVEVTADFTPDAALQVAAATFIAGVVRRVARWPSWSLAEARRRGVPLVSGFAPRSHTSRQGWLAKDSSYPRSPFTTPPDARVWVVNGGRSVMSLREIADRIFRIFRLSVARVADPFSLRLIAAVLDGRATSLLDLPDRPATYDDVGRLCRWTSVFPARFLRRSRYERVLMLAIAGTPLVLGGREYKPTAMRGWSQVVFSSAASGETRVLTIDALLPHLDRWTDESRKG